MFSVVYKATLLVCLAGTPIQECTRDTAVSVVPLDIQIPIITPIACLVEGQYAAARSTLVMPGEYGRIMCQAVRNKDKTAPKPLGD